MVDAADAPVLAVLTRAPSAGGKSRLFARLGTPPSWELLTALLLDTLEGAAVPGVLRVVAVTPADACAEVREIVGDARVAMRPEELALPGRSAERTILVFPQPEGDLGARMEGTFAALFARGAGAVALIGSDVPHIAASTVAEAFDVVAIDRDALAIGPAADGGYYLLAARRVPAVFSSVAWGSARVLLQTEEAAAADGFRVHRVGTLADVDTVDDLRRAATSGRARRTTAWVRAHASHILD